MGNSHCELYLKKSTNEKFCWKTFFLLQKTKVGTLQQKFAQFLWRVLFELYTQSAFQILCRMFCCCGGFVAIEIYQQKLYKLTIYSICTLHAVQIYSIYSSQFAWMVKFLHVIYWNGMWMCHFVYCGVFIILLGSSTGYCSRILSLLFFCVNLLFCDSCTKWSDSMNHQKCDLWPYALPVWSPFHNESSLYLSRSFTLLFSLIRFV